MPTLFLLRHAKSSWSDPTLADHDRPLAPRGRRAARRMAEHLVSHEVRPALVLCSSARRARETLDALASAMGDEVDVEVEDAVYGADAEDLLGRLRNIPDAVDSCMLIGHNPALHELAVELAGDGEEDALRQLRVKFPTGALATFDVLTTGWSDVAPGQAYLTHLVVPKALPEAPGER